MILESAQAFHSVRTVRNGAIQPSDVDHMQLGVFYAMVHTKPSITGINHGAVKQMINQLQCLLQKIVSLALIPSSASCQEYSMKYIYSTSQMSKLSLTLRTFSITGSVAGLFLTRQL